MPAGYNQVNLIGQIKPQIEVKPFRDTVKVKFYLQVEDLDFDYRYKIYKRHTEIFRVTFTGEKLIDYQYQLTNHSFVQVIGKLHNRTFKERMTGDKHFAAEIITSPKQITMLDDKNIGLELQTFAIY